MRFVSVGEFRTKSARVWSELHKERELVVTRNGKPIAIVIATDEQSLERSLSMIRQARALRAAKKLQMQSATTGQDKLSVEDIDGEVVAARASRPR